MSNDLYQKYGIQSIEMSYESPNYISTDYMSVKPWHSSTNMQRTVVVKINDDALKTLLHRVDEWEALSKKHYSELYIREQNPTVKKAYEKYQMFLELARTEYNDRFK